MPYLAPRYIYDRIRWELFARKHPDIPWLNRPAVEMLDTLLLKTDRGLEWGSGQSTRWFAKRLSHLTSVESDPAWYARVKNDLERERLTNVTYHLCPDLTAGAASEYVRVCDQVEDGSLGFGLVDGHLREQCALALIPKIAVGGILMWDNSNWFIDWPTRTPKSRYGKGPLNDLCKEFQERVGGWRFFWTSGGTSDSAFWIRPTR